MSQQYPETTRYAVYILNGMPFLPHYQMKGWYVAPGYRDNRLKYSSTTLKGAGARREFWTLWKRGVND